MTKSKKEENPSQNVSTINHSQLMDQSTILVPPHSPYHYAANPFVIPYSMYPLQNVHGCTEMLTSHCPAPQHCTAVRSTSENRENETKF